MGLIKTKDDFLREAQNSDAETLDLTKGSLPLTDLLSTIAELANWNHVRNVTLTDDQKQWLTNERKALAELSQFNLIQNLLQELPEGNEAGNIISDPDEELRSFLSKAHEPGRKELDITASSLTTAQIIKLLSDMHYSGVEKLHLNNNQLNSLAKRKEELAELRRFDLVEKQLPDLSVSKGIEVAFIDNLKDFETGTNQGLRNARQKDIVQRLDGVTQDASTDDQISPRNAGMYEKVLADLNELIEGLGKAIARKMRPESGGSLEFSKNKKQRLAKENTFPKNKGKGFGKC